MRFLIVYVRRAPTWYKSAEGRYLVVSKAAFALILALAIVAVVWAGRPPAGVAEHQHGAHRWAGREAGAHCAPAWGGRHDGRDPDGRGPGSGARPASPARPGGGVRPGEAGADGVDHAGVR